MDFIGIQNFIASFMQREIAVFDDLNVLGTNYLKDAINIAQTRILRDHDFELTHSTIQVTIPAQGRWIIVPTASIYGGPLLRIKKFTRAWSMLDQQSNNSSLVPLYIVTREYLHYHESQRQDQAAGLNDTARLSETPFTRFTANRPYVQRQGNWFTYEPNLASATNLQFDVQYWLDPLVADIDTNFLTQDAPDVLLYETIRHLNTYLKDDDRLNIPQREYKQAWDSLKNWDADQNVSITNEYFID